MRRVWTSALLILLLCVQKSATFTGIRVGTLTRAARRSRICCSAEHQKHCKKVVICGAGVIGSTLAYYMTLRGIKPIIVDRKTPNLPDQSLPQVMGNRACGGFMPSNWFINSELEPMAGLSFSLHEELADKFQETGFRKTAFMRVMTYEHEGEECMKARALEGDVSIEDRVFYSPNEVRTRYPWLDSAYIQGGALVNRADTAAQVDPVLFTNAMLCAAIAAGAELLSGAIGSIATAGTGVQRHVTGVVVDDTLVPADAVVIAMGAGSRVVQDSLNFSLPLVRVRGHALQLRVGAGSEEPLESGGGSEQPGESEDPFVANSEVPPCCMQAPPPYLEPRLPFEYQALMIPRPGGRMWVGTTFQVEGEDWNCEEEAAGKAGGSDGVVPGEERMEGDEEVFEAMEELVGEVSSVLERAGVERREVAVRAATDDGLPVIGGVPGLRGAVLSTGHGSWGLLLAPGSAVAVTELVTEGRCSAVDLAPFAPERFLEREADEEESE